MNKSNMIVCPICHGNGFIYTQKGNIDLYEPCHGCNCAGEVERDTVKEGADNA